jgi:hypothetical protein
VSPVSGASDIEAKYQYWIDFGAKEERERIIKLLENLLIEEFFPDRHTYERLHNQLITQILTRIKGENK